MQSFNIGDQTVGGAEPHEWHADLKRTAEACGIQLFSSPFDRDGVDFLEDLGVPAYKTASPEITDIPLIRHVARKGKPAVRATEQALGEARYSVTEKMSAARRSARSIFVTKPVGRGEILTSGNLGVLRSGAGLHPMNFKEVIGRRAAVDLVSGTPLGWSLVA